MIKYPKTPYSPWSDSYGKEDRMISSMSDFYGHSIIDNTAKTIAVTEKIDGSNTLIHSGNVYGRSVASPSVEPWMGMVKKYHAHKTLAEPTYFFYGEDIFGVHSLEYNAVKPEETFRVFAILDIEERMFLGWSAVKHICYKLELLVVPDIVELTLFGDEKELKNSLLYHMTTPSSLGGEKEGLVIRRWGEFAYENFADNVCKMVRPNHVQTDEHWRRKWKPCAMKG